MLEIDSLAQGGRGVARADGYVVFVSGGVARRPRSRPAHQGQARASRRRPPSSSSTRARTGSPIAALHEGEPCPGAPWQGLPYERQLQEKASQVDEALRRLGGLDGFELEPIVPAVEQWRYRNKLEYSFGEHDGKLVLGFHRRGSWRDVIDAEDCQLASDANNEARNEIRDWARGEGIPAYDGRDQSGVLRNLVVREGRRTGQVQTRLVTSPASFTKPPVDLHTVVEGPSGGTAGPTGVLGREFLTEELGGHSFRISPAAFFQTNTEMAERLCELARRCGRPPRHGARLRLLLRHRDDRHLPRQAGRRGVGRRDRPRGDLRRRAQREGATGSRNARFIAENVRLGVRPLLEQAGKPDVVIVDPPRAGLSKKIVRRVIECGAPRIVYVSCNPTTLAPNAAQLTEAGYRLRQVTPVDMFPHTPHVECVAVLER